MKTLLKTPLVASLVLCGACYLQGTALQGIASATVIVERKQPRATIVVPEGAGAQLKEAATVLQRYVQQSTGATLPIGNAAANGVAIHLGRSPYVDGLKLNLEKLDGDGFVLKEIDNRNYVIAGPTDWGTEFGVYEFLERYLGVRWLMPGADGVDVPTHDKLDIPTKEVRQQPAYWSRDMSPFGITWTENTSPGGARIEWARRNRLHPRISFHHNLINLFPPSKYAKTHPEFYPYVKSTGKRYEPKDDEDYNWQPNFLAPGIVEEAAKNIKEYFRAHPEATSYSLGMNDTTRFDESPESLALDNKTNYLNQRDASNTYFTWANAVVTEVLKEFPDKWFGTLAYHNIAEPPTRVKPHPRIVPFLTYDRLKWLDPELAKYNQGLTKRWAAVSPVIGWYDYVYGNPYMLPRMYPHQMQNYLSWGHKNHVQVHYAELYPNWGEGPKPWVFLKLQWNPDQNVDALLDDWYRHAVGPEAAPRLKEYFAIWEKFWTTTAIRSPWFKKDGEYLNFGNAEYLGYVDEADVKRSRRLIDEVVKLCRTPQQKARAEVMRRAWDYYEISAQAYATDRLAETANLTTEADALKIMERLPQADLATERREMLRRLRDPQAPNAATDYIMLDIDSYGNLSGVNWGTSLLWRLLPWAQRSAAVRARMESLASSPTPSPLRDNARLALQIIDAKSVVVSKNPDFEEGLGDKNADGGIDGDATQVAGWSLWKGEGEKGTFALNTTHVFAGKHSLEISGMNSGAPTQHIPFEPGKYYAIAHVFAPAGQPVDGTMTLAVQGIGAGGKWIPASENGRFEQSVRPQAGQWVSIVTPFEFKEEQRGTIENAQLIVGFTNFKPGQKVYLDEAGIYKLP